MEARSTATEPDATVDIHWDTTAGSLVHRLFEQVARVGPQWVGPRVKIYVAATAVTLVPFLVAAAIGPLPLFAPVPPMHPLPVLRDWNILCMILVTFPSLAMLCVSDQQLLSDAIKNVKAEGTLTISNVDERLLADKWDRLFHIINPIGLCVGTAVGLVIAYLNYVTYTQPSVGFWITDEGRLLPVGYVFLYGIFLMYALISIYILRNLSISLMLKSIVKHGQIHLLPLHPDKAGGLRPMGRLGLRNQYALTIVGVNVVLFVFVSATYLHRSDSVSGLMVAAIVAYLVFGPLVFVVPLLPFRTGMLESKSRLMSEVARRLRAQLEELRSRPVTAPVTREDEEMVDRLRKIGAVIDELPVWPFDAGTLRTFLTAYVIPIAGASIWPVAKLALDFFNIELPAF